MGGLAKVAIRSYIGTGGIILNATDCLKFLERKKRNRKPIPNFM